MGVATYRVTEALPDELRKSLPSLEELEAELGVVKKNPEELGHGG